MPKSVPSYVLAGRRGFKPPAKLTVDEWADKYRYLSSKSSGEPGRWHTARTPYLREVMRELSRESKAKEVVFIAGSQVGKTETGNNFLGYIIDQAPGPVMFVLPTVDLAKRHSKQRVGPLIEETPCLKGLVKASRERDSGNTILVKEFPGGMLILAGANSASGLKSTPIKYLITDEEDSYPLNADGEGSPVTLAKARMRTFEGKIGTKHLRTSTPTIKGISSIEIAYEASDQRRLFLPCPHCNQLQYLKFGQLKWPEGQPKKARYQCEHCGEFLQNYQKTWMLERGQWIAQNPSSDIPGFHLPALCSPAGWFSWADVAAQYEKALGDEAEMRVFVNTVLGESFAQSGEVPEWQRLFDRVEGYEIGTAPVGVLFLTAGVDVQKDRIEVQVVGWGEDKQSWLVDYQILMGDTSDNEVWDELSDVLDQSYKHESGVSLGIARMAIDSGYRTNEVYVWARRQSSRQVLVVKGQENGAAILGIPTAVDVTVQGKKIKRGVRVWSVATGMVKDETYRYLRREKPTEEGQAYAKGYCHFPARDKEFFQQLCAEQLVEIEQRGGRKKLEWQKLRDRNEVLDTRVYARAAANHFGLDTNDARKWKQLREAIEREVQAQEEERTAVIASSPTKAPRATERKPYRPKPVVSDDPYL